MARTLEPPEVEEGIVMESEEPVAFYIQQNCSAFRKNDHFELKEHPKHTCSDWRLPGMKLSSDSRRLRLKVVFAGSYICTVGLSACPRFCCSP